MRPRIMYIEYKGENLTGVARIGRVTFSKNVSNSENKNIPH